jgi:hypothetical protein
MPFADFIQGYTKAILRLAVMAGDMPLIRRDLSDGELSEESRQILFGGTGAFWIAHGTDIDSANGPPGLRAHVSWHAGRELAYVRMRIKSYDSNDWRPLLRNRMTNDALALRLVRLRWINNQLMAEEFDG